MTTSQSATPKKKRTHVKTEKKCPILNFSFSIWMQVVSPVWISRLTDFPMTFSPTFASQAPKMTIYGLMWERAIDANKQKNYRKKRRIHLTWKQITKSKWSAMRHWWLRLVCVCDWMFRFYLLFRWWVRAPARAYSFFFVCFSLCWLGGAECRLMTMHEKFLNYFVLFVGKRAATMDQGNEKFTSNIEIGPAFSFQLYFE